MISKSVNKEILKLSSDMAKNRQTEKKDGRFEGALYMEYALMQQPSHIPSNFCGLDTVFSVILPGNMF